MAITNLNVWVVVPRVHYVFGQRGDQLRIGALPIARVRIHGNGRDGGNDEGEARERGCE